MTQSPSAKSDAKTPKDPAPHVSEGNQAADETKTDNLAQDSSVEMPEDTAAAEIETLTQQLAAAEAKVEENWQLALRAQAEAENQLRRANRDVEKARKYALERFANDLVPVIDSMEQGMTLNVQGEASEAMREGLELTLKLMLETLNRHGIEVLDPYGQPFNPEHHEAMSMLESDEVKPDHVMQVFQKGYLLNRRVIRPARVVVARGPSQPIDAEA